jgi:hypothetical protein
MAVCTIHWPKMHPPKNGMLSPADSLCVFLYVIGMQSWLRPNCGVSGPNSLLYSSIIWNEFLIYAILRWLFIQIQTHVAQWRSADFDERLYLIGEERGDPVFWTCGGGCSSNGGAAVVDRYPDSPESTARGPAYTPIGGSKDSGGSSTLGTRTWREFIGDSLTALAYNRPGFRGTIVAVLGYLVLFVGLFFVLLFECFWKVK